MSNRNVKGCPKEFLEQVVKLALSSGHRPREIAEEFEISLDSLRRWVRQAQLDSGERKDGPTTPEREEHSETASRHPPRANGARDPGKSRGLPAGMRAL